MTITHDQLEEQKRLEKIKVYRRFFRTDDGYYVLNDLQKKCNADVLQNINFSRNNDKIDPVMLGFLEGKRFVFNYIMAHSNQEVFNMDILKILNEKRYKGEELWQEQNELISKNLLLEIQRMEESHKQKEIVLQNKNPLNSQILQIIQIVLMFLLLLTNMI